MVDKRLAPHLNNVVLVEGGAKTIQKYKRLMLKRIKWSSDTQKDPAQDEIESDQESLKESYDQLCHLVWESSTNQPKFGDKFRTYYDIRSDAEGKKPFAEK